MLLNLCFHMAMTAAVFAGGITLTGYLIVCQAVGTGEGARPRRCPGLLCHPLQLEPPRPSRRLSPQVGIILHYSSLSTLLWMAVTARVLYRDLTWKAPRQPDGDASQPAPRPMLRYGHPFPPQPHGEPGQHSLPRVHSLAQDSLCQTSPWSPRARSGHTVTPSPPCRFYLIAGGIPLIICGITAAVNIHNYHDNNP